MKNLTRSSNDSDGDATRAEHPSIHTTPPRDPVITRAGRRQKAALNLLRNYAHQASANLCIEKCSLQPSVSISFPRIIVEQNAIRVGLYGSQGMLGEGLTNTKKRKPIVPLSIFSPFAGKDPNYPTTSAV